MKQFCLRPMDKDTKAIDMGGGIGRISKMILIKAFENVDLLD